MEKQVLEHIVKTIKKGGLTNDESDWLRIKNILQLYGPLNYREYDEVMNHITKEQTKNDKNGTLGRFLVGDQL